MSWNNVLPEWSEIADRSVADLLDLARPLFAELVGTGDDPGEYSAGEYSVDEYSAGEDHARRARHLRMITTELDARAARLAPSGTVACACGATFATPDDLDDHFLELFIPDNDTAPDGRLHAEV